MRKKNKGAVLLIVLMVLILLIIIVFSYVDSISIDSMIAGNQKNEVLLTWVTRGGIELSKAYLVLDDEPEFDSLNEPWAQEIKKNDLGDSELEVVAVDEDRKFNIRACIDGNDDQKKAAKDILRRLIMHARNEFNDGTLKKGEEQAEDLADNIIEWLEEKSGSTQEANLSEMGPEIGTSDKYDNLSKDDRKINKSSPYAILTTAELLMVEGVTRSLLYGPPKKKLDEKEDDDEYNYDDDEEDEEEGRKPLLDFITCYSSNIRKININTAPKEVLMSLSEEMPSDVISAIMEARKESAEDEEESEEEDEDSASFRTNDIASKSNFETKCDIEIDDEFWNDMKDWLAVKSEYFSVVATAYAKSNNRRSRMKQTWRAFMRRIKNGNTYTLELMIVDREN